MRQRRGDVCSDRSDLGYNVRRYGSHQFHVFDKREIRTNDNLYKWLKVYSSSQTKSCFVVGIYI